MSSKKVFQSHNFKKIFDIFLMKFCRMIVIFQNYKKKLDFLKKKKLQLKSRFNNKKTKPQFDRYLKKKFQFIFIIIQVAILE